MTEISLYGDSILKGVLLQNDRYTVSAEKLEAFAKEFGLSIRNRSRFGATIDKGLDRINADVEKQEPLGDFAVMEYGGNDCAFNWEAVAENPDGEHLCNTPPEKFIALYEQAVEKLQKAGCKPILTTLPPIDPDRYLKWICRRGLDKSSILHWLGDENAIYRWQERYAGLVIALGERLRVPVVNVRETFLSKRRLDGLLCEDGIHPSDKGQNLILDTFAGFIRAGGLQA